jgi:hypothetical protein
LLSFEDHGQTSLPMPPRHAGKAKASVVNLDYESKKQPSPRPPPSRRMVAMGYAAMSCLLWVLAPVYGSIHWGGGLCVAAAAGVMKVMTCVRVRDLLRS